MRDGALLAVDVYRSSTGRVPAILLRTPYDRRNLRQRIAKVERVRLQATSSCYPDTYPNPNTGHDLSLCPPPRVQVAEQSLLTGGARGSSLSLPVRGAPPREVAA